MVVVVMVVVVVFVVVVVMMVVVVVVVVFVVVVVVFVVVVHHALVAPLPMFPDDRFPTRSACSHSLYRPRHSGSSITSKVSIQNNCT